MTVLFPIITVREILEYSCLYVLEMRKKNTCKRKKVQISTCTQVMEVLVISKTCIHYFFFHLAQVTESMEIKLIFSCTYHQNSCT